MAHYAIICDIDKCNGCYSCFLACKDEFVGNDYPPYSKAQPEPNGQQWLHIEELEHGSDTKIKVDYIPKMCRHCASPACAAHAPEGAVYKRADGIVLIDPEKSKAARSIMDDCPYGCVSWNDELALPQKCTLCAHMLDNGETVTRCTECCPTGALVFGDLDDPNSSVAALARRYGKALAQQDEPDALVRYLGLPRRFIAGECIDADSGKCAEDVCVILRSHEDGAIQTEKTDCFGDFQFRCLPAGRYELEFLRGSCSAHVQTVELEASLNLGCIALSAKERTQS